MHENEHLRIGELASEFDLNTKTIRYYEKIGLLPEPERAPSGYRLYHDGDRKRLGFILKAKRIGLSLDEIREILSLRDRGQKPCRRVLALVDDKVIAIDEQLRTLNDLRDELLALRVEAVQTIQREGGLCSIIEEHKVIRT